MRVPDLHAMHAAVAGLATAEPPSARSCAVIVPTRGAAEELRRTIEDRQLSADVPVVVLPDLLTRAELYDRLAEGRARLSQFDREVIFRRAALDASASGSPAPFKLRAGLIVEILAFYDELRRRDRTIDAFERLMVGGLEPIAEVDRGAERLLRLTRFLSAAFREFERRVAATGGDEHSLRAALLAGDSDRRACYRHIVVTVADQAADAFGLWLADYDLLARLPGLERLDVVATENVLATGFHQRLHDVLPGIEEVRSGVPSALPVLSIPAPAAGEEPGRFFRSRDREEELARIAQMVKHHSADAGSTAPASSRVAAVFQRPLPYLYLARQVFADAGVPYQALDSLPLAAEPFAAALDVLFSFAATEASRPALVELLSSPHWSFEVDGRRPGRRETAALDKALRSVKYFGGWDRLSALAAEERGPALLAAERAASELREVIDRPAASAQCSGLLAFIAAHEVLPAPGDEWYARHLRARAAVLGALQGLRDAHAQFDDRPLSLSELAGTVRRWIEGQTFAPRTGDTGLRLLDARAAAYAEVDEMRLVGLVDSDWPDRGRRGIFYPPSLLGQLGWPSDADRYGAARARFQDLLALPRVRVSLSTFTLEDDAIVAGSPFLEELDGAGLPLEYAEPLPSEGVFRHDALIEAPHALAALGGPDAESLALRLSRSSPSDAGYHGEAGARGPAVYAVSHVERYLECPFKYFASYVLRLPEERDDESGLTPQERGRFLHEVFEKFFAEWQASGQRTITTANLADALRLFERVAEERLATLGEADRALERTYLLGSAVAPGLGERAFTFEIEQGGDVIERLLEHSLEGEFVFRAGEGERRVTLRAKADRIDLLADGTLRVIDYKLGKAPKPARALQLPVYGVCAEQSLEGRHGRSWTFARGGYVAFREKNPFVALGQSTSLAEAVTLGQQRFLAAIDGIERGTFPVRPDEPFMCTRCAYGLVCRKDYIGDE
ncbi:MAG: hypothetical protein A3H96_11630 [Acidobacteria bacterium RIFCSPLOWO2_02_FULL_67_36]|nr:MAG: hypothetical protein A3H96_11630 [Acidobacteria bacterium RIFCSPLOWO2_02_FULL_67_36]OFW20851.1 MAG: hypothetical protein A3G21_18880 [Acidobacteria bacterium RIFCSPLOWO2_12_FULL_66_21]